MADSVFLDTNILVYANVQDTPLCKPARAKILEYERQGINLWISRQIIREFLVVLSRKMQEANNYDAEKLTNRIRTFEAQYHIAESSAIVNNELLSLERV
jgi:predicted nucleic acid-binding protein